ncbi:MAG: hypothetical protein WC058_10470 [Phycisphaeraceae bacterium]
MTLHRLKLRPRSPWRTPWHADTLTGMLLATCARVHGPDILRDRLIEPMLAAPGSGPPFVLSDACPGDLLPMPIWLRLADWPADTDRKKLKRKRWLTPRAFQLARTATIPPLDQLFADDELFLEHARHHNTLSRLTDTTGESDSGLAPFSRPETLLLGSSDDAGDYLSIYFRLLDPSSADLFLDLFYELALTGFGADASTGRGQFDILDDSEPVPHLDASPDGANAVICLSTFQPGPHDPTTGYWDAFPKFGKLGPELASLAGDHRKNTFILFKPGACFRTDPNRPFMGRAIPMQQLLPTASTQALAQHNINLIHPAFALTLPAYLNLELNS